MTMRPRPSNLTAGLLALSLSSGVIAQEYAGPVSGTPVDRNVADTGAIRLTGTISQLQLEPGRYTIALAVGRPDDLPEQAADAVATSDAAAPRPWELRRVNILIED